MRNMQGFTPIERVNFRRTLVRAVLLPLLLMAALAGVFFWQISRLLMAFQWVERSDQVIAQANFAQKLLVDMETGVRGYLVTGNPDFLEPYNQALLQLQPAFDQLSSSVADNPPQAQRVIEVRALYAQWETYTREVMALRDRGGDFASYANQGAGKSRMDAMRARFGELIGAEEALRDGRTAAIRKETRGAVIMAITLSLLLGGVLALFATRELLRLSERYGRAMAASFQLAAIVESSADAIIGKTLDGIVTSWNRGAEQLYGYTAAEIVGRPVSLIAPAERHDEVAQFLEQVKRGAVVQNHETMRVRKDGARIDVSLTISPVRDDRGQIIGASTIARDITRRKGIEAERTRLLEREQQARAAAEAASRIKDEFLATVSHELRTPLTAILGWARLLADGELEPGRQAQALETIGRNAKSQAQLVDDLLDVSRIITGKLRLDVLPVELVPVIEAAVASLRPAAEAKAIRLQVMLDSRAGVVSGDPERLQQVVWNLLSNAVKFTPKGGRVQVRLERVNSHTEIIVSDTGPGIAPEFLPHVFDRFRQADSSITREHGGLGLGLAIVRHLVELHGGTVVVESGGAGQGATFRVKLPLMIVHDEQRVIDSVERRHPTAGAGQLPDCPPSLKGLRVLAVDDEAEARDLLTAMLERCGAHVRVAASAWAALEALESWRPDVLVSDIGMPDEDGYALIRKVRALPAERGGRIPAVALTAYARTEDRVRALSSGYQVHVAKPVEPAELAAVVASLAGRVSEV